MTDKKAPRASSKELFETTARQYDEVEKRFAAFRHSSLGLKHEETLDSFIHESRRVAGNVGFCLLKGTVPEYGMSSMRWVDYNKLHTHIGLMDLILELWDNEEGGSK